MKKQLLSDSEYDKLLWEKVWKKVTDKIKNGNPAEALSTDTGISVPQINRYRSDGSLGNIREDNRNRLLAFIKYENFAAFKFAVDKEIADELEGKGKEKPPVRSFTSPYHFNIPARPDYFLGREAMLLEIHKRLTEVEARQNVLLLSSMGGMGKTTVLHEYLNRDHFRQCFNYIISISIHKNLERAFLQGVAAALKIDLSALYVPEKQLTGVVNAMRQLEGNNLLVIDNVNESDYADLARMHWYFRETGWKVLITTRTKPDGIDFIDVEELHPDEAVLLFMRYYAPDTVGKDEDALREYMRQAGLEKDVKALLQHIMYHTLFTELIAKTGNKNRMLPGALLKHLELQDLRHPELARPVSPGPHAHYSFNQLNKATLHQYMLSIFDTAYLQAPTEDAAEAMENGAQIDMLRFFSMLPARDIPVDHLRIIWQVKAADVPVFESRLDALKQIGWIKGKQGQSRDIQHLTYKMHHLIQEVVYEKLQPDEQNCEPMVQTLLETFENDNGRALRDKLDDFQLYVSVLLQRLNPPTGNEGNHIN